MFVYYGYNARPVRSVDLISVALGNIAPMAYEKQFAAKQPIVVSEIT
jgi:hypothetical protein